MRSGEATSWWESAKFCDYPAAAAKIKKIGGLLDMNMEALVALAPDIVITYPEHAAKLAFLQGRAKIVTVPHGRLADLLQSILSYRPCPGG